MAEKKLKLKSTRIVMMIVSKSVDVPHSSSGSASQSPEISFENLSPADKYTQWVATIDKAFREKGIDKNQSEFKRPRIENVNDDLFRITEDEISPTMIGTGTSLGTAVIGEVGNRILTASASSPMSFEQAMSDSFLGAARSGQTSSLIESLRNRAGGFFGVVLTGVIAGYTVHSYRQLAREIRTDIQQTFRMISNDQIQRQQLSDSTQTIIRKKDESWFRAIFDYYNPTPSGYLLLTEGIALDSNQSFAEAQEKYRRALTFNVEDNLRNALSYVYARSLRLSGSGQAPILNQINLIPQNTSFHALGEIERRCLSENGLLDSHHIPYHFLCPITQDVMMHPTYYTDCRGHRHYFEGNAIRAWLVNSKVSPTTNENLDPNTLVADQDLKNIIDTWRQTALKHD